MNKPSKTSSAAALKVLALRNIVLDDLKKGRWPLTESLVLLLQKDPDLPQAIRNHIADVLSGQAKRGRGKVQDKLTLIGDEVGVVALYQSLKSDDISMTSKAAQEVIAGQFGVSAAKVRKFLADRGVAC